MEEARKRLGQGGWCWAARVGMGAGTAAGLLFPAGHSQAVGTGQWAGGTERFSWGLYAGKGLPAGRFSRGGQATAQWG